MGILMEITMNLAIMADAADEKKALLLNLLTINSLPC